MPLSITAREDGPALVFELIGVLDTLTVEQLEPLVQGAIDDGRRLIVFDLGALTFVSSAGLRVFLHAYRQLQGKGRLRLAAPRPEVRQVFNITGLTARLDLYPTLAEALAADG
jgi:anti-anti-sigma factor